MELKDTIEMMTSKDYKERFKAEYYQTKIRAEKLHKTIYNYYNKKLDFEPTCSIELLEKQEYIMIEYLRCLEFRAELEDIELELM